MCILSEEGCELYFDRNSVEPGDFRAISVGDQVDYEEQHWNEHVRAGEGSEAPIAAE